MITGTILTAVLKTGGFAIAGSFACNFLEKLGKEDLAKALHICVYFALALTVLGTAYTVATDILNITGSWSYPSPFGGL